jgi:hypothetical protein
VNERIARLNTSLAFGGGTYDIVCECSRVECAETLAVPATVFEDVRGDGRRFLVRPGHEEAERVVAAAPSYSVVAA